jgi:SAM-dependent methyltransferase
MTAKNNKQDVLLKVWDDQWKSKNIEEIEKEITNIPDTPEFNLIMAELSRLTREGRILEAGCGLGRWAFFLQRYDYTTYGIDISLGLRKAKAYSERTSAKCVFTLGDVRKLPFVSNYFDFIISLGVIEHFPDSLKALEEYYRVLRYGGEAFVAVPNIFSFPHMVSRAISRKLNIWELGYEDSYSPKSLLKLMKKAGFQRVNVSTLDGATTLKMFYPQKVPGHHYGRRLLSKIGKRLEKKRVIIGFMSYAIGYK